MLTSLSSTKTEPPSKQPATLLIRLLLFRHSLRVAHGQSLLGQGKLLSRWYLAEMVAGLAAKEQVALPFMVAQAEEAADTVG
jgi:hypothetical protein